MLRGLFPRLFSQFREGGLIVGQFLVSNSGATLTPTANCYQGLTAAGDTGQYIVTLAGGARQIVVVGLHVSLDDEDDPTDARLAFVNDEDGINAGAGTIPITVTDLETASPVIGDLFDGCVLTITLLVNK
jgi:hypothetical protein